MSSKFTFMQTWITLWYIDPEKHKCTHLYAFTDIKRLGREGGGYAYWGGGKLASIKIIVFNLSLKNSVIWPIQKALILRDFKKFKVLYMKMLIMWF